jgi:hypothetical protein
MKNGLHPLATIFGAFFGIILGVFWGYFGGIFGVTRRFVVRVSCLRGARQGLMLPTGLHSAVAANSCVIWRAAVLGDQHPPLFLCCCWMPIASARQQDHSHRVSHSPIRLPQ